MANKPTNASNNVITLNNKPIELHQFTGKILTYKESSDVSVERIPLPNAGSRVVTRTKNEFFLVDDNGMERHFRLPDCVMPPFRAGHVMQVM